MACYAFHPAGESLLCSGVNVMGNNPAVKSKKRASSGSPDAQNTRSSKLEKGQSFISQPHKVSGIDFEFL